MNKEPDVVQQDINRENQRDMREAEHDERYVSRNEVEQWLCDLEAKAYDDDITLDSVHAVLDNWIASVRNENNRG